MTHLDVDQTTRDTIRAARTYKNLPPDDYQVEWTSLAHVLHERAKRDSEREYMAYFNDHTATEQRWSYAEIIGRAAQIANMLVEQYGVQAGERVATLGYSHPDTVACYFACWLIGATVTPQNVGEDDQRIAFILRNAEARVLLIQPEYQERAQELQQTAENIVHLIAFDEQFEQALHKQATTFTAAKTPTQETEALLVYTSGTTGAPKGVQLSHYNLLADCTGIMRWHAIDQNTRLMCILPIHHVNGIVVTLLTPMIAGAAVVLNRSFSASAFWSRVASERVHIVSLVPTILQYLCESHEGGAEVDLSHFRYVVCGAGTLAIGLAKRFTEQFNVRVLHGYGLSETTCYSCYLPTDLSESEYAKWMYEKGYPSIGVAIWPNEMAIHDQQGHAVADGERGEIVIRGHNVMVGYFQRPDANKETFKHGWFRSGDEGFIEEDEQGRRFIFITGRLKELINRGGVKYSPFEIEEILLDIPGVRAGLAIAFPNSWYGEEVGAYIIRESGSTIDAETILKQCREHMPFAKCPKVIVFGEEIPVTSTGKYQRLKLQEAFAEWSETQFRDEK